jgi:hypothetical protein
VTPAPNANGWSRAGTTVNLNGQFNPDGLVIIGIDYSATGAQPVAETRATGASFQFAIDTDGETTVRARSVDEADNHSPDVTATVRIDRTPPTVVCGQADANWHATDVSINCTASDALSRLAAPADASFVLTTAVPAGTETSAATTDSRTVSDNAGNSTFAAAIGDIKVDKKVPSITVSSPTATSYTLNQPLTANYQCADGGSGVASCAGPVASGAAMATTTPGTATFVVTGTDRVGNAGTQSVTYSVAYNICLQFDSSKAWRAGGIVPIKIALCDFAGLNASSPSVTVTATTVTRLSDSTTGVPDDAGNSSPDLDFHYSGGANAGYAFNLSTRGYTTGTYALSFTVSGDPTAHSVTFQVR